MALTGRPDGNARQLVDAFLAAAAPDHLGISLEVHPNDSMMAWAARAVGGVDELAWPLYLRSGLQPVQCLEALFLEAGRGQVLDLGAGYGRITRFLLRTVDAERLTVCDFRDEAVRFQEQVFGVRGTTSNVDPFEVELSEPFDLIVSLSLFSHLPEKRFRSWLSRLASVLTPGGTLAFSVNDATQLAIAHPFHFAEHAEAHALELELREYGTAWMSEAFVRAAVAEALGAEAHCIRYPRALWHRQDVYVVHRDPPHRRASVALAAGPEGFLDRATTLDGGTVRLEGWAWSRARAPVLVDASVGGNVVSSTIAEGMREDVGALLEPAAARSGFSFELPSGVQDGNLPIVVRARDTSGRTFAIHTGRTGCLPLALALEQAGMAYDAERLQFRLQLAEQTRQIDAFRSSRAWRAAEAYRQVRDSLRR